MRIMRASDRLTALGAARNVMVDVAAGDHEAFAELYDAYAPRVLGLVIRVLRDHAQAEEVTQEVFLELWVSAARYSASKGTPSTWIMTLAHRRAVDRVRASQASRDRDLRVGIRDHENGYDSVSEIVELTVEDARVKSALRSLTALQQRAIVLVYYEGLSYAEAAVRLDVPAGTVKTRLRDGLIRLRALLTDDELRLAS